MNKRYDNYKDSGVEWLGEIPSHWNISKIKKISSKNQRGNTPIYENSEKNKQFPVLNQACVYNTFIKFEKEKYNQVDPQKLKGKIKKNDILICSTGGGTAGRVGFWPYNYDNYIVDSHITVLRLTRKNESNFFYYLLLSSKFQDQIFSCIKGSTNQEEFSNSKFNETTVLIPYITEQTAIAHFLDNKVGAADNSEETLKKQKELLIEERKALIHNSVTQGLDPDVPMKDSGVEWIGMVPEHWNIKRLKDILTNTIQTGFLDVNAASSNGKYPFFTCSSESKLVNQYSFNSEALLIAGNGMVGSVKYFNGKFDAYQRTYVITGFGGYSPFFLKYFIETFLKKKLEINKKGSVIDFIKLAHLTEFNIPVFDFKEQQQIVDYLDKKTAKIDEAIAEIDRQIALLQEYKKTLINDAVTGKIKVYEGEP